MKIYKCYSGRLCGFLIENGELPITVGKLPDGMLFHIFNKNDNLDKLLTIWSNKSNLKK